jgi:16S rRNA (uracil1498-N3)-methyltransferase
MRLPRIFVEGPLVAAQQMELPAAASQHLLAVLRLRVGAPLVLFDGRGGEHPARLVAAGRGSARIEVGEHRAIERESPLAVTLLQGLARGERMDIVVQKATELGVARIIPVAAARSVVQLAEARAGKRLAHWQAVAVAACEQCGRNRVPEITAPMSLVEACRLAAADAGTRLWALDAEGGTPLAATPPMRGGRIALLVGPEGGLADEELETAALIGFTRLRLGPRVLRTETAGPAALAALQALAGDFGD